ncbi:MAG TPA: hypothetical protein VG347_21520 [Verrucomicrobiae bacterium]|nr:hypothetical protein [Verrucomicrobiae bacterium]
MLIFDLRIAIGEPKVRSAFLGRLKRLRARESGGKPHALQTLCAVYCRMTAWQRRGHGCFHSGLRDAANDRTFEISNFKKGQ